MTGKELKFVLSEGEGLFVEFKESPNKPHACSDGFFMRIGANSQKLSRDEIFSMGICSGRLRFDEQVCGAFDCSSNLDEEKVSAYLRAAGLNATLPLEEIPQYPEAAFREAIVNAVMHRDYFDASGDIMVEVFQNRLTVSNPGGLVRWLPPEDFGKYSRTRNRLIASLLMRTQQAEKMGTGIRRIQQALQAAGNPPAEFDYDDYNFSVTLFSSQRAEQGGTLNEGLHEGLHEGLNEGLKSLLKAIYDNPGVQAKEPVSGLLFNHFGRKIFYFNH